MVDVLPEVIDIVKKKGKAKCEESGVAAVFIDTTALLIIAGACFRKPDAMMPTESVGLCINKHVHVM
jgi:hypothetical protein